MSTSINCRRCKQPIAEKAEGYLVRRYPKRESTFLQDGDVLCIDSYYHQKCLPPILFHKLAGSLPVGQSPAPASLRNEHEGRGGLSPNRKRKRLARRVRYKRTQTRRNQEEKARAERQWQSTQESRIHDNAGLCHCPTFSKESHMRFLDSPMCFLTANGYCRYCGRWNYEIFRQKFGEAKLQDEIDKLALHDREKMRAICGNPA